MKKAEKEKVLTGTDETFEEKKEVLFWTKTRNIVIASSIIGFSVIGPVVGAQDASSNPNNEKNGIVPSAEYDNGTIQAMCFLCSWECFECIAKDCFNCFLCVSNTQD